MAYIKLGPLGDKFVSRRYNINLPDKKSAIEVSSELINGVLFNFMLTGFLVQIKKLEYDNIKIDSRTFHNLPITNRGVFGTDIIEPAINIAIDLPTSQPSIGDRYIVYPVGTGAWEKHLNQIMEYTATGWIAITPENGWSVPVIGQGISIKYSGTYPSGQWLLDIPTEEEPIDFGDLDDLDDDFDFDDLDEGFEIGVTEEWVREEIAKEAEIRSTDDRNLQSQINTLKTQINQGGGGTSPGGPVTASSVSIIDTGEHFISNNVEGALQELAQRSSGGVDISIIDVPATSGITYTVTWGAELISKHGNIPVSISAMIALPGSSLGTYRGIAPSQIDYVFTGAVLSSFKVTLNNFAGRIIIR